MNPTAWCFWREKVDAARKPIENAAITTARYIRRIKSMGSPSISECHYTAIIVIIIARPTATTTVVNDVFSSHYNHLYIYLFFFFRSRTPKNKRVSCRRRSYRVAPIYCTIVYRYNVLLSLFIGFRLCVRKNRYGRRARSAQYPGRCV